MRRHVIRVAACLSIALSAVATLAGTADAAKKPNPAPGAPTGVAAVARYTSLAISWNPPNNVGAGPIVGYRVGGNWGNVTPSCSVSITSCTVSGLKAGKSYTVKVLAYNAFKAGPYSSPIKVKVGLPDPPTGVNGKRGDSSVLVSWAPPVLNSGIITGYAVTASPGGHTCTTVTPLPSGTACTVAGLTNGTTYTFTATSTDSYGISVPSAPSAPVTPATLPGAPTGTTGTSYENSQALVSWTAPDDGGSPPTYTVTGSPGGQTCTTGTNSCTVGGLTNGNPYTFTVVATNVVGPGPSSAPSALVTPSAAPDVATGVTITSGNDSDTVSWTAPDYDGGSAITGYTVTASPGGSTCSPADLTTLSCAVSGLTNGTAYTFTVTATNPAGTSAGESASLFVPGCAPAPDADLAGCNFTGINLSGVDIHRSDLTGANLTDANLTGANLDYDVLNNVTLDGADLTGAFLYTNGLAYDGISAVGTTFPTGFEVAATYLVGPGVNISGVDFSGDDFTGAILDKGTLTHDNFTGADLGGVDLDRTDLTGSNFTGANLSDADLGYDVLNNVTLDGADLTGAFLFTNGLAYDGISAVGTTFPTGFEVAATYLVGPGVNISGVDFSGDDFTGAILTNGTLTHDNFTGADLGGVDLDRTDLTGSNFTGANLSDADLGYDVLNNVTLDGADLTGAFLFTNGLAYDGISAVGTTFPTGFEVAATYLVGPGVNISGVDFSGDDFTGAILDKGTLTHDNFTGADLGGVDLDRTDLTGSNFTGANLSDADLGYDVLNNVTLDGADLTGAFLFTNGLAYDGISAVGTTFPTGFEVAATYLVGPGVNISGVDFSGDDFTGAILDKGTLTHDNFTGADLGGVDLDQTDLTGSDLTGANLSGVIFDDTTCPDGTKSDSDSGTCVNNL